MRFCLCIFESDTVNGDCPVRDFQENDEIFRFNTDCWFTLLVLLFYLEILKKKSFENDQSTGHFQSFFCCFFRFFFGP